MGLVLLQFQTQSAEHLLNAQLGFDEMQAVLLPPRPFQSKELLRRLGMPVFASASFLVEQRVLD